jgi:hypothetical protein
VFIASNKFAHVTGHEQIEPSEEKPAGSVRQYIGDLSV